MASSDETDNIAYGVIAGLVVFILLHNVPNLLGKISPRLLPHGWNDLKDPYSVSAMVRQQSSGGGSKALALFPPWMRRLANGNKRFWEFTPEEIARRLEGRQITEANGDAAAELRQRERDGLRSMMGEHFTPRTAPATQESFDLETGAMETAKPRSRSPSSKG